MNFFKRATTSITRRPGKTVILMLLVFILGTITAGAISVRGAIQNTDANLRARMQPIASVSLDWQAWTESEAMQQWNELTWQEQDEIWDDPDHPLRELIPDQGQLLPEHIRAIGALPQVYFYDFVISSNMESFSLERYSQRNSWRQGWEPEWFRMLGASSTNMVQIDQGAINLLHGNQFTANDLVPGGDQAPILVSQEWANQNGLSIGSTFELYNIVHTVDPDGGVQNQNWSQEMFADDNIWELVGMEFTIIGIFEIPVNEDADPNDHNAIWQHEVSLNTFYVPNWVLEDVNRRTALANIAAAEDAGVEPASWHLDQINNENDDDFGGMSVTPLFILEDPSDMEEFRAAAYELLPVYHQIEDMASAFDDIESSMATMDTISFWILWVSIGATLLILTLLITLFLRDRRYEMGVYLAIGEKKSKIVSQILLEVVITSLVGITFAVFAGHFISSEMSRNMLMNELQASREPNNDWMTTGGSVIISGGGGFDDIGIPVQEMSISEMADAFQVRLGADTILLFYGVGIGAVILSTMIPVIYVVTLKPKKVLM